MHNYQTLVLDQYEHLGILQFDRPEVRNAINQVMIDEMLQVLESIDQDPTLRVLIVTGRGKAFMAGADIAELRAMEPLALLRFNEGIVRVNAKLEKLRQPVIAAINGAAMGGGLELALSCTLRIACVGAKLALPEVKLGIIPGAGGTQRLPRLIGRGRAARLVLTGEVIDAERAGQIGVVDEVVPDGQAVQAAKELAGQIMQNSPVAVEMAKDAMQVGLDLPLEQAVQYSQKNCVTCFTTQDKHEGMSAFLEKRKPQFQGK